MSHSRRSVSILAALSIGAGLVLGSSPAAAVGSAKAGATKSSVCRACHGEKGVSPVPQFPNIAGQKRRYLEKALRDYKSGARRDPQMQPHAVRLSEVDIEDLAAYFSRQNCP